VLPETSLGQGERELQLTGVPRKGLWRFLLGGVVGFRSCKQGSETGDPRRNQKRATIHELFLAEGDILLHGHPMDFRKRPPINAIRAAEYRGPTAFPHATVILRAVA
jgi:hypothetical protein